MPLSPGLYRAHRILTLLLAPINAGIILVHYDCVRQRAGLPAEERHAAQQCGMAAF